MGKHFYCLHLLDQRFKLKHLNVCMNECKDSNSSTNVYVRTNVFQNGSLSTNLSVRGARRSDYDFTLSTKFM